MGKWQDLLDKIRQNPSNVRFRDLCAIIKRTGYVCDRIKGSHHIFVWPEGEMPIINVQPKKNKAKPYQVRQVVGIIDTYGLEVE